MSRRSVLYSHLKQASYEDTISMLLSQHRNAKGKSLPMKLSTAQRIAGALHKARH